MTGSNENNITETFNLYLPSSGFDLTDDGWADSPGWSRSFGASGRVTPNSVARLWCGLVASGNVVILSSVLCKLYISSNTVLASIFL